MHLLNSTKRKMIKLDQDFKYNIIFCQISSVSVSEKNMFRSDEHIYLQPKKIVLKTAIMGVVYVDQQTGAVQPVELSKYAFLLVLIFFESF